MLEALGDSIRVRAFKRETTVDQPRASNREKMVRVLAPLASTTSMASTASTAVTASSLQPPQPPQLPHQLNTTLLRMTEHMKCMYAGILSHRSVPCHGTHRAYMFILYVDMIAMVW
jgi:hypothetical protein